jgi:sulfonate transport system substrate-binding protein
MLRISALAGLVLGLLLPSLSAAELPREIRLGSGGLATLDRPYGTGLLGWVGEHRLIEAEFAKDPIAISWQVIKGAGPGVNEAFANHAIDLALYGDFSAIIGRAGGIETTVLLSAGRGSTSYLSVPKNSTATSITDLVGKRIGIHKGRPFELAFAELLASAKLKYSDFRIFNLTPQDGLAALSAGSIDALYGTDGPLAEINGTGRTIWGTTNADPHASFTAEIFAASDFVKRYPEVTQRLVNVLVKAAADVSDERQREAYLDFFARAGSSPAVVQRDWAGIALIERNNPLIDPYLREHYRRASAFAKAQGLIRREVPDLDGWFNPTFLDRALDELKLRDHWTPVSADGANFRHRLAP